MSFKGLLNELVTHVQSKIIHPRYLTLQKK